MNDLISRQEALQLVKDVCDAIMSCCGSHYDEETEDEVYDDIREVDAILKCNKEIRIALKNLPSAQPEKVCVAEIKVDGEELQRCIDEAVERIKVEVKPEIIRCKDCIVHGVCRFEQGLGLDGYCSQAERRTDE